jgi:hypothetical protein
MTVNLTPVEAVWTGEYFRPVNGFWLRKASQQYAPGEVLRLVDEPERSKRSHDHYFVSVEEAWKNMPEEMLERWPTAKHLRSYALIKSGYADTHTLVCASNAEAQRVAAFMKPLDEFGVVLVSAATVTRFTAKSQSKRAMGARDFQDSKEAVLQFLSALIGIRKQELTDNAGAAA